MNLVRRSPEAIGYKQSRWSIDMIIANVSWLHGRTHSAVSQMLERLEISYKRGRSYVHSPDVNYKEKLNLIKHIYELVRENNKRYRLLYLDELTFYLQPTISRAYEEVGREQPLAQQSHAANLSSRVIAAMDAVTGQVVFRQQNKTTIPCLVNFWYDIYKKHREAEVIYIVLDNWPLHFHPEVLAPLQPQNLQFKPKLPGKWPQEASAKAKKDNLPIQLVCLPTYASWLNPIEKLWRWLKSDILHLHRQSCDWSGLKKRVVDFMEQFADYSPTLLRYTGLLPS